MPYPIGWCPPEPGCAACHGTGLITDRHHHLRVRKGRAFAIWTGEEVDIFGVDDMTGQVVSSALPFGFHVARGRHYFPVVQQDEKDERSGVIHQLALFGASNADLMQLTERAGDK